MRTAFFCKKIKHKRIDAIIYPHFFTFVVKLKSFIMSVAEIVKNTKKPLFSFEILPPLKGKGLDVIHNTVRPLMDFNPSFITITSHREQYDTEQKRVRRRPGTVAIAAALKNIYHIPVVPHILCGGFTKIETEYVLIDLNFLGITDILALRGDGLKSDNGYKPEPQGNAYAEDLLRQIGDMNKGKYIDDTDLMQSTPTHFSCAVAGYPENHYASLDKETDIAYLKRKVEAGAEYIITQMFFDNAVYFDFVNRCRAAGITIPIIPGIKPIGFKSQVTVLPELFHIGLPQDLSKALHACETDEQAKQVGTEWAIMQAKELAQHNVPSIHLFTYSSSQQSVEIAQAVL
jgi:methylenetetrahydrofolate reductase (NADPH)